MAERHSLTASACGHVLPCRDEAPRSRRCGTGFATDPPCAYSHPIASQLHVQTGLVRSTTRCGFSARVVVASYRFAANAPGVFDLRPTPRPFRIEIAWPSCFFEDGADDESSARG